MITVTLKDSRVLCPVMTRSGKWGIAIRSERRSSLRLGEETFENFDECCDFLHSQFHRFCRCSKSIYYLSTLVDSPTCCKWR